MPAPETEARQRVINILTTTFAADGLKVQADRLNGSLGDTGPIAGVSPVRAVPQRNNQLVLEIPLLVQVFGRYNVDIDPRQKVDPAAIEAWAERFRQAVKAQATLNTPECWFISIDSIEYPTDPTGNITRFVAQVTCYGNNTAET